MDVDKLFNLPKLSGTKKRQLPDAPTPELLAKRMRVESDMPAPSDQANEALLSKRKPRGVTMEDVEDEDAGMTRDFAPGGDADYFVEEDEEGRFYGGGLTEEQKSILKIFEDAPDQDSRDGLDDLSITGIRRLFLRFERAMKKNQDHRSKYPEDPTKFIDSEADLDAAIKALLPLSQTPTRAYPELVGSGTISALVDLLSHENADIVIDVVELIRELTDEDVGNEEDEEEGGREEVLKGLIEGFLKHSILNLLVENLTRLNESEESDREGVFHVLGIFENILGFNPELGTKLVSETSILQWLLKRISNTVHDANRGYAGEVLSILLQDDRQNRLVLGQKNGIEILLQVISQFRKRDPVDADETEFMENAFASLCSALVETENKPIFLKEEGVDLMVLIMKEKRQSRSRAIKTLDHALSGPTGTANCEAFVEALGLKTLFFAFMGKAQKQKTNAASAPASEDTSHILGIIASLFSNLASDTTPRVRLLSKFVENNYEKVDRLLETRENAEARLQIADQEIEQERKDLLADGVVGEDEGDTWYLRRLDGGLFVLQTVDYILGWICMEDDGVRAHVTMMLGRKNKTLKDIVSILKLYHDNVGESETQPKDDTALTQREILGGLITFLESC